jgi:hypothetical protein
MAIAAALRHNLCLVVIVSTPVIVSYEADRLFAFGAAAEPAVPLR